MTPFNQEKRRKPRHSTYHILTLMLLDEHGEEISQGIGRTLNVSDGGIMVETRLDLEVGQQLLMAIGSDVELDVRGRVAHVEATHGQWRRIGVEFLAIDYEELVETLELRFPELMLDHLRD